jgi:hypothetical protein
VAALFSNIRRLGSSISFEISFTFPLSVPPFRSQNYFGRTFTSTFLNTISMGNGTFSGLVTGYSTTKAYQINTLYAAWSFYGYWDKQWYEEVATANSYVPFVRLVECRSEDSWSSRPLCLFSIQRIARSDTFSCFRSEVGFRGRSWLAIPLRKFIFLILAATLEIY